MEIIIHRVNSIKKLRKIPNNFGVEIDLRVYQSKIILNHEPFKSGDTFTAIGIFEFNFFFSFFSSFTNELSSSWL